MTDLAIFAFLMVFLRCSAMFLSSPIFGAQNIPLMVRILSAVCVSGALTFVVQPRVGPVPQTMGELVVSAGREIAVGLIIGSLITFAMEALTIAGGIMDLQTGLGSSHILNPMSGVQSTLLSHLKSMLGLVVFVSMDAHHLLIGALVSSYGVFPTYGAIQHSLMEIIAQMSMLSLQIAAPVLGSSLIVDASLALLSRAVPQMQAMQVGMPAKIGAGLATVALGLPMTVVGVNLAVTAAFGQIHRLFQY